jgi:hypothetical protein
VSDEAISLFGIASLGARFGLQLSARNGTMKKNLPSEEVIKAALKAMTFSDL